MRISRLKYMKENPDKTAWRNKNMSYPEKCFLEKIKELKWDKKYQIVCEKSFYPFFIDFAFINEKIAIEIDGSQHLEDERKKSDEIKDKKLINDGWIVYRITAKKINEEIDIVFNDINKIIKNRYNYNGVLKTGIYKNEKFCECGKKISNNSRMCMTCSHKSQRKEKPPYKQLINEIKEYGYKGTGKKYGVSDNCIRKWKKKLEKWKNDK